MIVNNKILNQITKYHNIVINDELKQFIFQEYGDEPFPYEWSEQDLHNQISKLVKKYMDGDLEIKLKSPLEKVREENAYLKDIIINKINEVGKLSDHLYELEGIIKDYNLPTPNNDLEF